MGLRAVFETPTGRRIASAALLVALLLVGGRLFTTRPLEVDVAFRFGADAPAIRGARIDYVDLAHANVDVPAVRWEFGPDGAPPEKVHRVRLLPGQHRVDIELHGADGRLRSAPAHIDVPDSAGARIVVEVARPTTSRP